MDLAWLLESQTQNWTNDYNNTTARHHIVNTTQGLKTPPLLYMMDQQQDYRTGFRNGLFNIALDHGRVDDMPNADEAARENKPIRGTELCAVTEGLLSTEIAAQIWDEAWLGDKLETMAYNSLPAAFSPDMTAMSYYVPQNQVVAGNGNHDF